MYNILRDNGKYTAVCILNNNVTSPMLVRAIVDTGAEVTCICARELKQFITEQQLIKSNCPYIDVGGFVNGNNVQGVFRVYLYTVKQFTIGTLDLGTQTIGIYFDSRVKENVIGLDILQKLYILQFKQQPFLYLFDDVQDVQYFSRMTSVKRKKTINIASYSISLNNYSLKFPLNYVKYDKEHPNGYIDIGFLRCYFSN